MWNYEDQVTIIGLRRIWRVFLQKNKLYIFIAIQESLNRNTTRLSIMNHSTGSFDLNGKNIQSVGVKRKVYKTNKVSFCSKTVGNLSTWFYSAESSHSIIMRASSFSTITAYPR